MFIFGKLLDCAFKNILLPLNHQRELERNLTKYGVDDEFAEKVKNKKA